MSNVPRILPARHRFSKITPLGHLETQFPDRREIGSCFRPFRDRSCPAFGQFKILLQAARFNRRLRIHG